MVVRKNLSVEKGEQVLFADYRYFFYLDERLAEHAGRIGVRANDRCDQENLNRAARAACGPCKHRSTIW